jgi:hypothetical protein
VRAWNPMMDTRDLRAMLENSARDLGNPGRDPTYGHGLIQTAQLCQPPRQDEPVVSTLGSGTP